MTRRSISATLSTGAVLALVLALAACGGRPQPRPAPVPEPPPAPPPPPPPPGFTAGEVWTREPGLVLRSDSAPTVLPWIFMRLQVLRVDSAGLYVRCLVCRNEPTGWIDSTKVAYTVRPPLDARRGDLADFALAVRAAARAGDFAALRPVMATDFVHSHWGAEGALEAISAWNRGRANDIRLLPFLLDRGIVAVRDTRVWAAPPQYATTPNYQELRSGFRLGPDGWEWLFLVSAQP